ncbi:MAG: Gfo/Idh/MocA family oxidoreductase [Vulcanimicrobiaceae bacterium]
MASLVAAVDAVVISTPAAFHTSTALTAIDAGCHVLVEKPLALSVEDARRIAVAGETAKVCVVVGDVRFFHPAISSLLTAIERGSVGRVSHVRARRCKTGLNREVEDVWWSFSLSDIALTLAIFETSPIDVRSSLHTTRGRIADFAYADLDFGEARSAHVESSWSDFKLQSHFEVFGSTGLIRYEDCGTTYRMCRKSTHGVEDAIDGSTDDGRDMAILRDAQFVAELNAFVDTIGGATAKWTSAWAHVGMTEVLDRLEHEALRTQPRRATP